MRRILKRTRMLAIDAVRQKYISHKVLAALVDHVFMQTNLATFASLFCAFIIVAGLYSDHAHHPDLYWWAGIFLLISAMRLLVVWAYKSGNRKKIKSWRNRYIVVYSIAGLGWGLAALMLLPHATPLGQMLIVLMVAGVTAGAVPLASGIPVSSIGFLIGCIMPFVYAIANLETNISWLFNFTLILYLVYMIGITLKNYSLLKHSIELRFENEILVKDLSRAKETLQQANCRLEQSSTHDPLTKTANRRLFETNLKNALAKNIANKACFALLYIDLDKFKEVNDTYGHAAGDELLLEVARRLTHYLRDSDQVSRVGGDEFTVLLENVKNIEHIRKIVTDINYLLRMPVEIKGQQVHISASIGIGIFPQDGMDIEKLIMMADKAMYKVKARGGNNYQFAGEIVVRDPA